LRGAAGCDVLSFDETCAKKKYIKTYVDKYTGASVRKYNTILKKKKTLDFPKLTGRQETFGQRLSHFAGTEKSDFQHIRNIIK